MLTIGVLAILLFGCGTASSVKFATVIPETTSFFVQDDRPAEQRAYRVESGGEYIHLGDDKINPTPPDLLRSWLHAQMGSELSGKQVFLVEFDVTVYDPVLQAPSTASIPATASVPGGYAVAPLADLLLLGIMKMARERAVFVKIVGKIGSTEFSTFVSEGFTGGLTEEQLQGTIVKALDKIIPEVRRALADR